MNELDRCSNSGCANPVRSTLYEGQSLCEEHYMEKLRGDFDAVYRRWLPVFQPVDRLRSLMGRLLEEVWQVEGGTLSKARLRDRAFNFKKAGRSFTFEITRHPGAFKNGYVDKRVVQKWEVDVDCGSAKMVAERAWQPGDFDGKG